jgi:hypothetical protein
MDGRRAKRLAEEAKCPAKPAGYSASLFAVPEVVLTPALWLGFGTFGSCLPTIQRLYRAVSPYKCLQFRGGRVASFGTMANRRNKYLNRMLFYKAGGAGGDNVR